MKNHFKYLTVGEEDKQWGIYMNVIGSKKTNDNKEYPSKRHPLSYYYTWKNGRILSEYQLNYITSGGGIFENKHGSYEVKKGSFIVIFPGEWHRYKPNKETGWTENYVGFEGDIAKHFMSNMGIGPKNPIINSGMNEQFINCYTQLSDVANNEAPGYQLISAGIIIKLLGLIAAEKKEEDINTNDSIKETIKDIRFIIRNNVESDIIMQEVATQYNLGYSYFRKMFKKYTGLSPKQYHIQLKVMRAKELLLTTDKSVKEICYDLGFQSTSYFSRIFKQKMGITPLQVKEKVEEFEVI